MRKEYKLVTDYMFQMENPKKNHTQQNFMLGGNKKQNQTEQKIP